MDADERVGDPRFVPELLFTDGLPAMDDEVGYRGAVAARAAGITYRQLDYWARTELVEPTVRGASGSGSQRLYGFRDFSTRVFLCSRSALPSKNFAARASATSLAPH
jgi:hypothetical protein